MRRHAAADAPFYSTAHLPHPPASQLVSEARASLLHPTRPFTPAAAASDRAATLFWAPRKETMTATTMQTLCDDSADAGVSTDTADAVAHEDRGLDGDDEDNGARSSTPPHAPFIERLDSIKPNASPDTDPEWLALLEVLGATTSMREDISTHELSAHLDRLDWLRSPSPAGAAKQDAPDPCRADSGVALLADAGPDALATATVASQPASAPRAANLADWDVEPPVNVDALARKRDAAVNRARDKRRRDTVVQALIKWMHEAASAASAVAASSLILRLTREEAVLLSACQMLFKLSKNEANDSVFLAQGGIDALLAFIHSNVRHIPTFFGPRCHLVIFAAGALKNITNGSPSQARLVKLGGVQRLGFAIRQLVDRMSGKTNTDAFVDVLVRYQDEKVSCVATYCTTLWSEPNNCTHSGADTLQNHPQTPVRTTRRKAVITRMCFVLANLSAERGDQHVHLAAHVAEIAALLGMHADAFMAQARASTSGIDGLSQVDGEDVDLATKIVRLVANMALDETCGRQLAGMAEMESMVDILYAVSDGGVRNEELALNIANALANLTFYLNSSSGLYSRAADIVRGLLPLLMHDNCEAVLEACRACANMSMCRDIGGFEDSPVCEIMTILLDHADPAVVWQACGVIMNLSAHRRASAFGATVLANEGDAKLCEVLVHAAGEQRWDVATAAAQALVNLCAAVGRQDVIARASAAAEDALAQTDPAAGHEAFWRVCDRLLELSAASDAGSDDAAQ
nr:Armadillo repeat-containing protein 2 [Polyrhizophydium stewartii]